MFREHRIDRTEIAIIGFHGQTGLHRPASRRTVQIGDGPGWHGGSGSRWRTISGLPTWRPEGRALAGANIPSALAATLDWPRLVAVLDIGTLESIVASPAHLPRPPRSWIVAGGGARHQTLVAMLTARLAPDGVVPAGARGRSGDSIEAQAFAYLAVRTRHGAPITFPGTTGVARPMPGGVVAGPMTGHATGRT